ncbi:Gfo/Idh/MocA family protein [Evansella sp. AB-rgal1]|uniref:Gfo/Idh/MocA family protein n=1 Tax=Evansella sp. AB-rgal1 TaxID=3242696 RepID=UPI00359E8FA3
MSKLHIGIIGLGAVGERLIKAFEQRDDIVLAAFCDTSKERLTEMASIYDVDQMYTNYEDLLKNNMIDAVYIAVPPKFHEQIVLDTIKANKHILCEKPLANSVEEARNMLAAVRKSSNLIHAMHFPLNYQASLIHFEKLIKEGFIGDLRRINVKLHFPHWPRLWQQNEWVASREQGGFILEVGVHWIQVIQRVFGKVVAVRSRLQFPEDPEACETSIVAEMKLEDGTVILVDGISNISGEEHLEFAAYGTNSTLKLINWRDLVGGENGKSLTSLDDLNIVPKSLIDEFVNSIQGYDAELYGFNVGYEAQIVLEALRYPEHDGWQELKY